MEKINLDQIQIRADLINQSHFPNCPDDKLYHNVYDVKISYDGKKCKFKYYDSAHNTNMGIEPTRDDILQCIINDYNYTMYTDFDSFCGDMGYDSDSRRAEKIYQECLRQSRKLQSVFSEYEIREMQEIIEK